MTSKRKNRRDHYIPQGYLKGFIAPERASLQRPLWHFDIQRQLWTQRSAREVGYADGFYDRDADDQHLDPVDQIFVQYENRFPRIREQIIANRFVGWNEHLPFLLAFAQMMRARSPLFFQEKRADLESRTVSFVDSLRPGVAGTFVHAPKPVDNRWIKTLTLADMEAEIRKGADWLYRLNWVLRYTESPSEPYIISEQVVVASGPPAETIISGLQLPQTLFFFPLSWQVCLIGSRLELEGAMRSTTTGEIREVQRIFKEAAKNFLISPRRLEL